MTRLRTTRNPEGDSARICRLGCGYQGDRRGSGRCGAHLSALAASDRPAPTPMNSRRPPTNLPPTSHPQPPTERPQAPGETMSRFGTLEPICSPWTA